MHAHPQSSKKGGSETMTNLAFARVLTLGPDIDLHACYEVGLIIRSDAEREERWFLPVEGLAFADRSWPDLERFQNEHPQGVVKAESKIAAELGSTSMDTFAKKFVALTRGATLVCSPFDEERLRKIVRSQGLVHTWADRSVDPEILWLGFMHELPEEYAEVDALGGARRAAFLYEGWEADKPRLEM
jgi:hypothetical protein